MLNILSNIPVWVFPLFILLLVVGLRASKDRQVPIIIIYLMPCLGLLTLRNIMMLSPPVWIWIVAAIAYALGTSFGLRWQPGKIIARSTRFAHIKGEWLTLTAMMIIFWAGFANGFLSEVAPAVASSALFAACFAAVTCLPAGQFLGRALATLRAPLTTSL